MISIVPETPEQHAVPIEALYDATFGPGHFAKTAERLREYNISLPSLNRVALVGADVVAAVRVWPVEVEIGGAALFIGPVAVAPSHRGDRLGQQVTADCLQACTNAGWTGAILIGAASYFAEVGFRKVPAGTLSFPGPQDPARIMVCNLAGNADIYAGRVRVAQRMASVDIGPRHSLVSANCPS